MNEKKWTQWRHKVEAGGVLYESAAALVDRLRGAYQNDPQTRDSFDEMAWNSELTAVGIGDFEATLVIIPINDVRR